jgi:hypothetical protein
MIYPVLSTFTRNYNPPDSSILLIFHEEYKIMQLIIVQYISPVTCYCLSFGLECSPYDHLFSSTLNLHTSHWLREFHIPANDGIKIVKLEIERQS